MPTLLVEGWRATPNSFAVVNQFQCLELLRRKGITLFHRDVPYWNPAWKPVRDLFDASIERELAAIPAPPQGQAFDAVLRMGVPFDFTPSAAARTTTFATCEFGIVSTDAIAGDIALQRHDTDGVSTIITPSHWSRQGLVNSGAPLDRIAIIPHGFDPDIFHPLPEQERQELRRRLGWEGSFVFLNISAMTPNKGIPAILRAIGVMARQHPSVKLVLKGLDSWFYSNRHIDAMTRKLPADEVAALARRVAYVGGTLSFREVARYYQAADAYVAPYSGEGFNMPVLEAIACGLPIICTAGGPTDDFTTAAFALRIDSRLKHGRDPQGRQTHFLAPDQQHLVELMRRVLEDRDWMAQARQAGPAFVIDGYTWQRVVDRLLPVVLGEDG